MVTASPKRSAKNLCRECKVSPWDRKTPKLAGHHSTSPAGPRMAHADGQMLSLLGSLLGSLLKPCQGPISQAMRTNGRMPQWTVWGHPVPGPGRQKLLKRRFPSKMQVAQHHVCSSKLNFIDECTFRTLLYFINKLLPEPFWNTEGECF